MEHSEFRDKMMNREDFRQEGNRLKLFDKVMKGHDRYNDMASLLVMSGSPRACAVRLYSLLVRFDCLDFFLSKPHSYLPCNQVPVPVYGYSLL